MRLRLPTLAALVVAILAIPLAALGAAGGDNNKPKLLYVFKLNLQPRQEVPPVTGLRARAEGNLTLDVTRDGSGHITAGKAVFYFNYRFPGSLTFTGLHVHQAPKGTNGAIVIDSGAAGFTDADGIGNVTAVVASVAVSTLNAIVANPQGFYVNLHTSVNPGGAMRAQLRGKKHDDDD